MDWLFWHIVNGKGLVSDVFLHLQVAAAVFHSGW